MEIELDIANNSGTNGKEWFKICEKCQIEVAECCRDLEMTLFPDELGLFMEHDPKHVKKYKDGTFGYNTKRCIFLLPTNECQLQKTGKPKPIDCIIYPLSFKNGKIYLDRSCWAKHLLNVTKATALIEEKITKFPNYLNIEYYLRNTDVYLKDINLKSD